MNKYNSVKYTQLKGARKLDKNPIKLTKAILWQNWGNGERVNGCGGCQNGITPS